MADQEVLDRLDRLEATLRMIHMTLVRLEWRLEAAGVFPGNVSYGSDQYRYALEHNIHFDTPKEDEPISDEEVTRVLDWLGKHEDEKDVNYYALEQEFPGMKYKLKTILQFLHMRGQFESVIKRLATSFGGSQWIASDPYSGERKTDGRRRP